MSTKKGIRKAKDGSFKVIFNEPEFFAEFIRDFVDIDILKDIEPSDIEDISERFLPLFQEGKDSDTVKRIDIKGDAPLFVVTILEHESKVNYRTSFKMLQYITLVLDNYEKEAEKKDKGATTRKGFRYPPILPIVYYDGPGQWTAETDFFKKTLL
ncbi:MAG: Rpn family recombination-promoting nuclease/putative transposase, partial [Clostridiales Family XIII bacterium]|nr:Rpn family recombination-promoting nuclease/putative transposase [Clostridiales Family XIII bacterium]